MIKEKSCQVFEHIGWPQVIYFLDILSSDTLVVQHAMSCYALDSRLPSFYKMLLLFNTLAVVGDQSMVAFGLSG